MESKTKLSFRDVGKEIKLSFPNTAWTESFRKKVQVIMAIKAPRGRCFIFKNLSPSAPARQAEAINAFMQQHREVSQNIRETQHGRASQHGGETHEK